ncbi:hypothetical protein [Haladaptatus sp. CMAA 1911]|uniref:hypothetical protein n=1 Tax=Haladaptatus sp. CMAA 1911 TaxID=3368987 RepID=UPI0037546CF6
MIRSRIGFGYRTLDSSDQATTTRQTAPRAGGTRTSRPALGVPLPPRAFPDSRVLRESRSPRVPLPGRGGSRRLTLPPAWIPKPLPSFAPMVRHGPVCGTDEDRVARVG